MLIFINSQAVTLLLSRNECYALLSQSNALLLLLLLLPNWGDEKKENDTQQPWH